MNKKTLQQNIDIININLHRAHQKDNRKEIDRLDYELKKQNDELIKILDSELKQKVKNVQQKIEEKKDIYKKVVLKGQDKRGRKVSGTSYTTLILKSLMDKKVKSLNDAVDKVDEWKPGREKQKIETQMKTIIRLVSKQKEDRWKKYYWNEDKFLMVEK